MPRIAVLLLASAALGAPGRNIRYAESSNRLIYAFVFGSKDTCRVIRRLSLPVADVRQRFGADWRGGPGDKIVAEFSFGRYGRPIHIVPGNDGKFLVAFANRAADGSAPTQDRVHHLHESGYAPALEYDKLPAETPVGWPELPRALPRKTKPKPPPPPGSFTYAFVSDQSGGDRLLLARQTEGKDDFISEIVCFAVKLSDGEVELPSEAELQRLLGHEESLFRAGAAWAAGRRGGKVHVAAIKVALTRAKVGAERVELARALVRCGDASARKHLRALLADAGARHAAAAAFATLPPERGDASALADAIADESPETAHLVRVSLVRLGKAGLTALIRTSRSSQPDKRAAAARTLGRLDAAAAEKRLLSLVLDQDKDVQKAAASALTSPPRSILPEHHADYARALDACRKSRSQRPAFLLSVLAAHARIHHEKVLKALVDLASFEKKAIWALGKLTREELKTPEDCKRWWKER